LKIRKENYLSNLIIDITNIAIMTQQMSIKQTIITEVLLPETSDKIIKNYIFYSRKDCVIL